MLEKFKNFVHKHQLLHERHSYLLAVSGGLDSCVMAHLFAQAKFSFAIAHVNFQLRGADADGDENFCRKLAQSYNVPFHSIQFDTKAIAQEQKTSIQLAARSLRYEWFAQLQSQYAYTCIATAHHANDSIETFLYNFSKGTGLKGLLGIPMKNDHIIRPMLFASRAEIETFAEAENLKWREDSSNADDKYLRNKVRHQVVPVLKDINPALEKTSLNTFQHLQEAQNMINWAVKEWGKKVMINKGSSSYIAFQDLLALPFLNSLLFEWFKNYGFHSDQIKSITQHLQQFPNHHIGATFYSETHCILIDRKKLILSPNKNTPPNVYQLAKVNQQLSLVNGTFAMNYLSQVPHSFPQTTFLAYLNLEDSDFPLQLRHWKNGDLFQPLGMKGKHQKLQDFFTHQKVTRLEKDHIWILETAKKKIAWVVGYRIDERFKITDKQNTCYTFTFKPH